MIREIKLLIRTFWQKWRQGPGGRSIRVDFYTRKGCCLCDEALNVVTSIGSRYRLELHLVDVDQLPDLQQAYGDRVPVIMVNGRERFHGRINRVLLERLFEAEAAQG